MSTSRFAVAVGLLVQAYAAVRAVRFYIRNPRG